MRRWREKVLLPQFFAPQIRTTGGGEVGESKTMDSAASDHSSGIKILGDEFSSSKKEDMDGFY